MALGLGCTANHYVWLEYSDGILLAKWGHYPETDGRIDPRIVTRIELVGPRGRIKPLLAFSREASERGGVEVVAGELAEGDYTVGLAYDRGFYSITGDGRWVYGDRGTVEALGLRVGEVRRVVGFAKAHFNTSGGAPETLQTLGFDLELVLENYDPAAGRARILALHKGAPVEAEVKLYNRRAGGLALQGGSPVELVPGINVFTVKHVVELGEILLHMVSTLTIQV